MRMPYPPSGTVKHKIEDEEFIFFYGKDAILSNYFPSKFIFEGIEFNCAEQYYHYRKADFFNDENKKQLILKETNPITQRRIGAIVCGYDDEAWHKICYEVMKQGLICKFDQNKELREYLTDTNNSTLVEASPTDLRWGIGMALYDKDLLDKAKWKGRNLLGKILMEIREYYNVLKISYK